MADNTTTQAATLATIPSAEIIGADRASYSGQEALIQLMRSVAVTGSEGARTVLDIYGTRADTYTAAASGTTLDIATRPSKYFALQVKGTGASATSWTVILEGSLDGTNFTEIFTHTNTVNSDGFTAWSSAVATPCLYIRSRCSAVVLGGATNIVATILGVP